MFPVILASPPFSRPLTNLFFISLTLAARRKAGVEKQEMRMLFTLLPLPARPLWRLPLRGKYLFLSGGKCNLPRPMPCFENAWLEDKKKEEKGVDENTTPGRENELHSSLRRTEGRNRETDPPPPCPVKTKEMREAGRKHHKTDKACYPSLLPAVPLLRAGRVQLVVCLLQGPDLAATFGL